MLPLTVSWKEPRGKPLSVRDSFLFHFLFPLSSSFLFHFLFPFFPISFSSFPFLFLLSFLSFPLSFSSLISPSHLLHPHRLTFFPFSNLRVFLNLPFFLPCIAQLPATRRPWPWRSPITSRNPTRKTWPRSSLRPPPASSSTASRSDPMARPRTTSPSSSSIIPSRAPSISRGCSPPPRLISSPGILTSR